MPNTTVEESATVPEGGVIRQILLANIDPRKEDLEVVVLDDGLKILDSKGDVRWRSHVPGYGYGKFSVGMKDNRVHIFAPGLMIEERDGIEYAVIVIDDLYVDGNGELNSCRMEVFSVPRQSVQYLVVKEIKVGDLDGDGELDLAVVIEIDLSDTPHRLKLIVVDSSGNRKPEMDLDYEALNWMTLSEKGANLLRSKGRIGVAFNTEFTYSGYPIRPYIFQVWEYPEGNPDSVTPGYVLTHLGRFGPNPSPLSRIYLPVVSVSRSAHDADVRNSGYVTEEERNLGLRKEMVDGKVVDFIRGKKPVRLVLEYNQDRAEEPEIEDYQELNEKAQGVYGLIESMLQEIRRTEEIPDQLQDFLTREYRENNNLTEIEDLITLFEKVLGTRMRMIEGVYFVAVDSGPDRDFPVIAHVGRGESYGDPRCWLGEHAIRNLDEIELMKLMLEEGLHILNPDGKDGIDIFHNEDFLGIVERTLKKAMNEDGSTVGSTAGISLDAATNKETQLFAAALSTLSRLRHELKRALGAFDAAKRQYDAEMEKSPEGRIDHRIRFSSMMMQAYKETIWRLKREVESALDIVAGMYGYSGVGIDFSSIRRSITRSQRELKQKKKIQEVRLDTLRKLLIVSDEIDALEVSLGTIAMEIEELDVRLRMLSDLEDHARLLRSIDLGKPAHDASAGRIAQPVGVGTDLLLSGEDAGIVCARIVRAVEETQVNIIKVIDLSLFQDERGGFNAERFITSIERLQEQGVSFGEKVQIILVGDDALAIKAKGQLRAFIDSRAISIVSKNRLNATIAEISGGQSITVACRRDNQEMFKGILEERVDTYVTVDGYPDVASIMLGLFYDELQGLEKTLLERINNGLERERITRVRIPLLLTSDSGIF